MLREVVALDVARRREEPIHSDEKAKPARSSATLPPMRRVLLAVVLALPFAASAWASAPLATWAGARVGAELATAIALLPRAPSPTQLALFSEPDASLVTLDDPSEPAPTPGNKPRASPVHGLHIRAAAVLRLAQAGARPSGEPVAASGARPAGLALRGVGGLGVGLRDGDVLTDVAGAPASSPGAVVGAVLAARGKRAPAISGHVWRGVEIWQIVVDQPYLD